MSWQHVICCQFRADMGDTQIPWLNESREWHVTSCHVSSTTLLGDVVCCLFLLHVVTQQKRMLTWRHICHVGNMSQNVTCHWCCCHPSYYGNRQQFLQSFRVFDQGLNQKLHLQISCYIWKQIYSWQKWNFLIVWVLYIDY